MKTKYLVIALFSLGLVCASCGDKKKKENPEAAVEQAAEQPANAHEGHDHESHEGHDH